MALFLPESWRGFAHFWVESRRNVLKKSPEERTFSELYILEEIVSRVKFICNLPFSKRLEVCKLLRYGELEPETVVYKQGDPALKFYLIFTGSIKIDSSRGQSKGASGIRTSGEYFGEDALTERNSLRFETATVEDKCEVIVLNKQDYDSVLGIGISPEIKEKVEVLKKIKSLCNISERSLQRLASLLTARTYPKNRVIAFQGEDAVEMYFMKSGECRVVMEVYTEPRLTPRPLPQAALKIHRDSRNSAHEYRKFPQGKKKNAATLLISLPQRSKSISPTLLWKLQVPPGKCNNRFRGVKSTTPTCHKRINGNISEGLDVMLTLASSPEAMPQCSPFSTQDHSHSQAEPQNEGNDLKNSLTRTFDLRCESGMLKRSHTLLKSGNTDLKKYTLKTFLREFQSKDSEDLIPDMEFRDRASDFQEKLENWAQSVIERERICKGGLPSDRVSLKTSEDIWKSKEEKMYFGKGTIILDVGGLNAGDFFGEVAVLHHSKRKAYILTVSTVEVLVLSKHDLHRQVDRDILESLSENNYKKADEIYQEYQKTCRWNLYKKKVVEEVVATRRHHFPNLCMNDVYKGKTCMKLCR